MSIKLTKLATSGGCGCKLPPAMLHQLLDKVNLSETPISELLVGSQTSDDAAVWQLTKETAIVATVDFFSPIVDDPHDFGVIAATNALSDVYSMGATPLFSLVLAAFPKKILSPETMAAIFTGGKTACQRAKVIIAGGHTINAQEPLYGLAVIGTVSPNRILTNAMAKEGDAILLGKPLGIGVLSVAAKQEKLSAMEYQEFLSITTQLNQVGADLSDIDGVHALTDVTGFGVLGHLLEICRASNKNAQLSIEQFPWLTSARQYAEKGMRTSASVSNWDSIKDSLSIQCDIAPWQHTLLTDPQTSGGLLVTCTPESVPKVQQRFQQYSQNAVLIGHIKKGDGHISIS